MPFMILSILVGIIFAVAGIGQTSYLLIILGSIGSLYYLCYPAIQRWNMRRNVRNMFNQGHIECMGRHEYSITGEGVHDITEFGDSFVNWKAIENVVWTNNHLFILIRPLSANVIPQRAFPDDATYNQFAEEVRAIFHISQTNS